MGFLKSPEIPLEGLIKITLEGNFFRFPCEEEKTRTRAVGFLKSPEIPLEDTYFTPLHVADCPRVMHVVYVLFPLLEISEVVESNFHNRPPEIRMNLCGQLIMYIVYIHTYI